MTKAKATHPAIEEITNLVDAFCKEHLNDEYATLCHKLVESLARKQPTPLVSGKPNSWACGIVRTIGWVNFLDDPKQQPHMRMSAIDQAFGVSEGTGQGKSRDIRKMMKIHQLDPKWTLPSLMSDNPIVWMLEVDGFIVDVRTMGRDIQEEAFRLGLIPWIPADQK